MYAREVSYFGLICAALASLRKWYIKCALALPKGITVHTYTTPYKYQVHAKQRPRYRQEADMLEPLSFFEISSTMAFGRYLCDPSDRVFKWNGICR